MKDNNKQNERKSK